MQISRSQRAQWKSRWPPITRTRAGDLSGHGCGVERCSAAERRVDHRDDPEGSGVMAPGLRLVSGPIELADYAEGLQESRHAVDPTSSAPATGTLVPGDPGESGTLGDR